MKIGICTCYDNHNYGSMLQAYATYVKFVNWAMTVSFCAIEKNLIRFKKSSGYPDC